jgi:acylglycerol lipase
MSYSHNTGTFIGKGGTEIFFQNWCVDSPRGVLVIAHGVGEHSGRYDHIVDELKGKRISVYALDQRGHGRSGGKRGHVDSFMDYVDDLKLFIDIIQEENNSIPLVLLGHSMGGVVACKYALAHSEDLSGLILSSPGLSPSQEVPGWKKTLVMFLSSYLPRTGFPVGIDPKLLSHDPDVVEAYENDRFVHSQITAKWATEFTKNGQECLNRALELRMPILALHGKDDMIVDYRATEKIYHNASSLNKELYLFKGLYHETMNEIEYKKVIQIISRWIIKIFGAKKTSKLAKRKTHKRPITKVWKKANQKVLKKPHKKAPKSKGAKK